MSKKSSGQFSNPSSTPFDGIFADDNASSDSLLTGHFQNNTDMPDIAYILGDHHSVGNSTFNTTLENHSHYVPSNHHNHHRVGVAITVPMDTGTTTPKEEMSQRILEEIQQHYYATWKSNDGYTSAYVNPFTREIFLSGELINHQVSKTADGLVWYQTEQESQDAAAARALDCFELREKKQRPYGLRVKECPYERDCGPPLPASVPAEARRFGMAHNKPPSIHSVPPGFSADVSSMSSSNQGARSTKTATTAPKVRDRNTHPISTLAEFYRNSDYFGRHKGMTLTKTNFVTWHDGPDHVRIFTCALVCPVSGEIFLSGTWTHHEDDCTETNDGLRWYNSKKKAEGAAAAAAHDCFSLRDQLSRDGAIAEIRFCIEDPYQKGSRSQDEIARLVPREHWIAIQRLQASSRSGSS